MLKMVPPSCTPDIPIFCIEARAAVKKTTTENQRFSVVFYGLMNPLVIRLEPLNPNAVW